MQDVDFNKAMTALPVYCFQLLPNVREDEQKQAAEAINALKLDESMDTRWKSLTLGLTLLTITGDDTLKEAVKTLGDSISSRVTAASQPD